jgi:hypothetical protein
MLQWNSKVSATLVIALLTALASFNAVFSVPELLNFAW